MVELFLYNGAESKEALWEIDDWGPEEVTLGPFYNVQVTYGQHIKCYIPKEHVPKGGDDLLDFWFDKHGLVHHDGKVYGDFLVRTIDALPDFIDSYTRAYAVAQEKVINEYSGDISATCRSMLADVNRDRESVGLPPIETPDYWLDYED